MAQDCPRVLTLPDDQESLSCTIEDWARGQPADHWRLYTDGVVVSERGFLIVGSGPIEVIFTLEERIEDDVPAWFELAVADATGNDLTTKRVGKVYRVLLQDPDSHRIDMSLLVTGTVSPAT